MLEKLETMISAHMRKLHIYKEHEQFRQSARVAIWCAWQRFDAEKGDFEPYAFQTIRGALLYELKMMPYMSKFKGKGASVHATSWSS